MGSMLLVSYLGTFGGIGRLNFPQDILLILPLSMVILHFSQKVLVDDKQHQEITANLLMAEAMES